MRVVSLLPAATDMVAALGGAETLVGITHECDDPSTAGGLPRVTTPHVDAGATPLAIDADVRRRSETGESLFALDAERIAALAPDVILTQAVCGVCAVRDVDVRALGARLTPAPAVVALNGTTLKGIFADIEQVGLAIGLAEEAEELVLGLRARLGAVHDTLKRARAPRTRVVVIEWTDPVFVAGHWVPEMVRRAGGEHVLVGTGEHSRTFDVDTIRAAAPEGLVVAPCGFPLWRARDEARALLAREQWEWARGLPVWMLDGNALTSRPGPRVVRGVEIMARLFHPHLFSPASPGLSMSLDATGREPLPHLPRSRTGTGLSSGQRPAH